MISLRCASADEGFGVGHTRSTQTKGVWVWGQPTPLRLPSGQDLSLVFIDTEGFESTGKADAYDDRIFALSALISSLLIYNLPEAIRESDIQKLSFAVDLAEGFYSQSQVSNKMHGTIPLLMPFLWPKIWLACYTDLITLAGSPSD